MAVSLKQGERWTEMFLCLFSNLNMGRMRRTLKVVKSQFTLGKGGHMIVDQWDKEYLLYFLT